MKKLSWGTLVALGEIVLALVPLFVERYPLVELGLVVDDVLVDIVDHAFDAGT
ncbi:hypothetical protein KXR94_21045 [Stutzerimonas stutzeri]